MAIVGAGGIGFDVATFITDPAHGVDCSTPTASPSLDVGAFLQEWGIDGSNSVRGGIEGMAPKHAHANRDVWLLQRKKGKLGAGLGKTTGWIHRAELKNRGVNMLGGVAYERIDDKGLHIVTKVRWPTLLADAWLSPAATLTPASMMARFDCDRTAPRCWRLTRSSSALGRSR